MTTVDVAVLFDEIRRYLSVVDLFREEGCEPTWLPAVTKSRRRNTLKS